MKRLLLVEDQAKDVISAAAVAESLGIDEVEACNSVRKAMLSLEKGVSGEFCAAAAQARIVLIRILR